MEHIVNKDAPTIVRRRRRAARQQRDKTPERAAKGGVKYSDEESSSAAEHNNIQTAKMQIRPGGIVSTSTHRDKILSRRNKTFANSVARSASTSRRDEIKAESPEIFNLMRSARRSLSTPRHKEESSESNRSSPHKSTETTRIKSPPEREIAAPNGRPLTRLEVNLQKFEEERRLFEIEKLKFEREKREVRLPRRLADSSERRRILDAYRKTNLKISRPTEENNHTERRLSEEIVLQKRFLTPEKSILKTRTSPMPKTADYESSTASVTQSDERSDIDDEEILILSQIKGRRDSSRSRPSHSPSPQRNHSAKQHLPHSSKRKIVAEEDEEAEEPPKPKPSQQSSVQLQKKGFIHRTVEYFVRRAEERKQAKLKKESNVPEKKIDKPVKLSASLIKNLFIEARREWSILIRNHPEQVRHFRHERNKCLANLIVLILYCGFGGLLFRFTEGSFENMYKCGVRRVKRDFIDHLWLTSHNLREDDWKSSARNKLRMFEEELHTAHEAGVTSYSGMKSWNFVNGVLYCLTVVTTIGYGHITPKTTLGQAITIVYAVFGIPLFLILLADFGKVFTRSIKFLWAFVRRVYYTGSCRKVRKQAQVQEMMRGINMVYDIAIRRPSAAFLRDVEHGPGGTKNLQPENIATLAMPETPLSTSTQAHPLSEAPSTPFVETFEVDDEFNLPISLATAILLLYIFLGAAVYYIWEDWSYFQAIYFVFISMSTIGFGDYVPNHPIFMMCSIIYLVFGLALTSMCINVVQLKLSDHFRAASAKIGATIGLTMAEEEAIKAELSPTPPTLDIPQVHIKSNNSTENKPNENAEHERANEIINN